MEDKKDQGILKNLFQGSHQAIKAERANQAMTSLFQQYKGQIDSVYNQIAEIEIKQDDLIQKLIPTTTVDLGFTINAVDFVNKRCENIDKLTRLKLNYETLKEDFRKLFGKEYQEPEKFI